MFIKQYKSWLEYFYVFLKTMTFNNSFTKRAKLNFANQHTRE